MPVKTPAIGTYWLQKETVYKVTSVSSATDEVILRDLGTHKMYQERFATFHYAFKQVFKIGDVATWLNKSPRSLYRYEQLGLIHKQKRYPVGASRRLRFYTTKDVLDMHDLISEIHQGRPRKDGRVVNNSMPDKASLMIMFKDRFDNGFYN